MAKGPLQRFGSVRDVDGVRQTVRRSAEEANWPLSNPSDGSDAIEGDRTLPISITFHAKESTSLSPLSW